MEVFFFDLMILCTLLIFALLSIEKIEEEEKQI